MPDSRNASMHGGRLPLKPDVPKKTPDAATCCAWFQCSKCVTSPPFEPALTWQCECHARGSSALLIAVMLHHVVIEARRNPLTKC